jgi:predicted O-linked N-acetylglucosamine transferase (SPINDLY family)
MRARIEATTTFRDVTGRSTAAIIAQIQSDGVGMLFDIAGHTEHARPDIFAARPAPIQVNYLGQAGTLGAAYFACIPTDAFTTPAAEQVHFAEKFMYMDGCYFPSDPQRPIAEPAPTRGEYGLPDDAFVFFSQAATFKVLPQMFEAWMRLLSRVPGSVMWLRPMRALAKANLKLEARQRGIAEERIVFAPGEPLPRYLARFRLADLYLDTYPFGSHTTVNDSLYAGLPVVTLAGRSMAARASGSQIRAAGLGELVATSLEEYEAIALSLVRDRHRLGEIATRLRTHGRESALFDMRTYAAGFERALLGIWENWRSRAAAGDGGW